MENFKYFIEDHPGAQNSEYNFEVNELCQEVGPGIRRFLLESGESSSAPASKRKCGDAKMTEDPSKRANRLDYEEKMDDWSANQGVGEKEEVTVEQSVFSNHLVSRNILKFSTLRDLKSYREVNHVWNTEATKIICSKYTMTMKPIKVLSEYVKLEKEEHWSTRETKRIYWAWAELKEFMNLIEHSKMFPCPAFEVVGHEWNDERKNFFRVNGCLVKSLKFEPHVNEFEISTNSEILGLAAVLLEQKYLPNLEILSFRPLYRSHEEAAHQSIKERVEINKLHTLNIGCSFPVPFLLSLLATCGNLKNIYCKREQSYEPNYFLILNTLLDIKKMHLLKDISLCFNAVTIKTYKQVLQQELNFQEVEDINLHSRLSTSNLLQVGEILTELFSRCSSTLKKIDRLPTIGHIPSLTIPTFPNFVKMDVELCQYPDLVPHPPQIVVPLLPVGVNLVDKFPNLQKFVLRAACTEVFPLNDVLQEPMIPLLSLRVLEIRSHREKCLAPTWMKYFTELFPNITFADFEDVSLSDLEHIWGFRSLEKLAVTIEKSISLNTSFQMLDSAFTGFSEEIVMDLYGRSPADLNLSHYEAQTLRVKPSIVNLKHLRKINICFARDRTYGNTKRFFANFSKSCTSGAFLKVKGRTVLSCVTKLFGFDMLQGCPVSVVEG